MVNPPFNGAIMLRGSESSIPMLDPGTIWASPLQPHGVLAGCRVGLFPPGFSTHHLAPPIAGHQGSSPQAPQIISRISGLEPGSHPRGRCGEA